MRVFLVGEQFAAAKALDALAALEGVTVVGVACDEASGSQRVARCAAQLGVPVMPSRRLNEADVVAHVRRQQPDLGLNVNSLVVFGDALLQSFARAAVNFHPGPLPEYAGLHVHQWAIINGETTHAVTFHRMEKRIDAGDVLLQAPVQIDPADTGLKLFMRCIQAGAAVVGNLVSGLADGSLRPRAQDLSRRRYFGAGPYDWELRFEQPGTRVVNIVRALDYGPFASPLGTAVMRWNGQRYAVREARLVTVPAAAGCGEIAGWTARQEPIFMCADGTGVAIPALYDGNRRVAWDELLAAGIPRDRSR